MGQSRATGINAPVTAPTNHPPMYESPSNAIIRQKISESISQRRGQGFHLRMYQSGNLSSDQSKRAYRCVNIQYDQSARDSIRVSTKQSSTNPPMSQSTNRPTYRPVRRETNQPPPPIQEPIKNIYDEATNAAICSWPNRGIIQQRRNETNINPES